jgi:hypothetical protein
MSYQHRLVRRFPARACAAAILLFTTLASGADRPDNRVDVNACSAARSKALELAQSGHLRDARELFESCAKPACGSYLNQECTSQATQLDADIPSVVPVVTDGQDAPRVDVEVRMDGVVLTSKLGGQALPVDPGLHEFTFSADQKVFATQKLMIVQGQRNRPVAISMRSSNVVVNGASDLPASSKPAGDNAASDRSSPGEGAPSAITLDGSPAKGGPGGVPWVIGSVGLAGLGAGALLVYWGRVDNDSLVTNCPNGGCSQASVDHVRTMYLAGDIAAGAGLAAVVVSTVWLLAGSHSVAEKARTAARCQFDVQPARSGGLATLSGAF